MRLHNRAESAAIDIRHEGKIQDQPNTPGTQMPANHFLQVGFVFQRDALSRLQHHPVRQDMLDQLQQVQKMGPIGQIMSMIPGMGGMANEAQAAVDRGELKRTEAIIRAMTPAERRDPTILTGSRRRRIAAGAGTTLPEVNRLVKQFSEMQKLMKQLSGGGRRAALAGLTGGRH